MNGPLPDIDGGLHPQLGGIAEIQGGSIARSNRIHHLGPLSLLDLFESVSRPLEDPPTILKVAVKSAREPESARQISCCHLENLGLTKWSWIFQVKQTMGKSLGNWSGNWVVAHAPAWPSHPFGPSNLKAADLQQGWDEGSQPCRSAWSQIGQNHREVQGDVVDGKHCSCKANHQARQILGTTPQSCPKGYAPLAYGPVCSKRLIPNGSTLCFGVVYNGLYIYMYTIYIYIYMYIYVNSLALVGKSLLYHETILSRPKDMLFQWGNGRHLLKVAVVWRPWLNGMLAVDFWGSLGNSPESHWKSHSSRIGLGSFKQWFRPAM